MPRKKSLTPSQMTKNQNQLHFHTPPDPNKIFPNPPALPQSNNSLGYPATTPLTNAS